MIAPQPLIRLEIPDEKDDRTEDNWGPMGARQLDRVDEQRLEALSVKVLAGEPLHERRSREREGLRAKMLLSDARRLAIARLLWERGPLRNKDISEALDLHSSIISRLVAGHPWFSKPMYRNPFEAQMISLTDAGRAAAKEVVA